METEANLILATEEALNIFIFLEQSHKSSVNLFSFLHLITLYIIYYWILIYDHSSFCWAQNVKIQSVAAVLLLKKERNGHKLAF